MNEHLNQLCREYPAIDRMLRQYGENTLEEYLKNLQHKSLPGIFPAEDLLEEVRKYLTPFFGEEIAAEAASVIDRRRCISTANHHHMAFEVKSVQENLLYDRWLRIHGETGNVVPFFAASDVNMTNVFYPRGVVVYDCNLPEKRMRLPIFPWKLKRTCIAGLPGISREMVERAQNRLDEEKEKGTISSGMYNGLSDFYENVLLSDSVQKHRSFREQTTVINGMMSGRYFRDRSPLYLWMDLETIATGLFRKDIECKEGILYQMLFCPQIRNSLLKNLNGISGCWTDRSAGTHFFWGLDDRAIMFPLYLEGENSMEVLKGINSLGEEIRIHFTEESLCENLKERKIIPALLITFLEIYFLRDFTVLGGFYQPEYLARMQEGLVRTFEELAIFERETEILRQKNSGVSMGLIFLKADRGDGVFPVSSAELMKNPIFTAEMDRNFSKSVMEAYEMLTF